MARYAGILHGRRIHRQVELTIVSLSDNFYFNNVGTYQCDNFNLFLYYIILLFVTVTLKLIEFS